MRKILIWIYLFLWVINANSQLNIQKDNLNLTKDSVQVLNLSDAYTTSLPQVILPSPQVALLQNYLDFHVDEARGTTEVSIPLYEISVDGISIPIALSYQTSGIKFKQYDGEIAAGWVLTCNYNTSREVLGKPDESHHISNNFFNFLQTYPPAGYIIDRYLASLHYNIWKQHAPASDIEGSTKDDSIYDQFSYNLPTTSGDFIIGDNVTKKVNTYSINNDRINLNIESDNISTQIINGIDITDDNGNIFYLGKSLSDEIEYEVGYSNSGPEPLCAPTMWPLLNIITKNNHRIDFEYTKSRVMNHDFSQQNFTIVDGASGCHSNFASYFNNKDINKMDSESLVIDKITTDKEIILFKREKKSDGTLRITAIEVTDRLTNSIIKRITLTYEYTEPHNLLTVVSISDSKNTIVEKYNLEYILDFSFRNLYSDQWGYYRDGRDFNKYGVDAPVLHKEFKEHVYRSSNVDKYEPINFIIEAQYAERAFNQRADYYSLKKITFPTGGHRSFEYESNKFGKAIDGCGIRVKRITSDDNVGKKLSKTYKYGNNEDGLGDVSFSLSAKQFGNECLDLKYDLCSNLGFNYVPRLVRTFSTLPKGDINLNQIYVRYNMITIYEEEFGTSNRNGKIVSTYNNYRVHDILPDLNTGSNFYHDYRSNLNEGAYVHMYAKGRKNPLLKCREYYDNNRKIKEETYDYINTFGDKTFTGLKIEEKVTTNSFEQADKYPDRTTNLNADPYNYSSSFFKYTTYDIELGSFLLDSKTITEYFKDNTKTSIKETYTYNDKNQLKNTNQTTNNSKPLVKEYKYPWEYTVAPYPDMTAKNIISPVIEQTTKNNGNPIGWIKNNYSEFGSLYLPSSTETSTDDGSSKRTDITYNRYDEKGNILEYKGLDDVKIIYVWSYNYQYPIAEIRNATETQVLSAVKTEFGVTDLKALSALPNPDVAKIKKLVSNSNLSGALVTTYAYKPLVGMIEATDPRGVTTYYEYDSFGRLKRTYIKENSTEKNIQTYEYNYRNK